ncbi:MAG TPA: hypothetical protein VGJ26_19330, partial [Pirellulales bacterium]
RGSSRMLSKEELRKIIRARQDDIATGINEALSGKNLTAIEPVLARVGRGSELPHWYRKLKRSGVLPNLDGKTIGSVIEMLLVGVLETSIFAGINAPRLRVNPARGVDLPDLDLGVKSPSENFCTSEPYFSAYERLLGSDCDLLVLLTDYQTRKKTPPLRLQLINWRYLTKTQVADIGLCAIARAHRKWLIAESEATAQRVFRFLAYVNQSDWRGRYILRMLEVIRSPDEIDKIIGEASPDFSKKNKAAAKTDKPLLPDSDLEAIERIRSIHPRHIGVIEAADNWVVEVLKDAARSPSADEWKRLKSAPLDGMIGMSFALQWRYNFGRLFGVEACDVELEQPKS